MFVLFLVLLMILNVELTTDFTLDEIVVVDRKFFEEKSTNTVKVIDSDQISRLPVTRCNKYSVTSIGCCYSGWQRRYRKEMQQ